MLTDAGCIKEEIPNPNELQELGALHNEFQPKLKLKEERTLEESNYSETRQDDWSEESCTVLNQQNLSISAIKQEQFSEGENHLQENFAENNSFIKDYQELSALQNEHIPKFELKEECKIEESSGSETEQEDWFEVTASQNQHLSTEKVNTDHLPYQCTSCNYVFGIKSSFMDHEKNCKESLNVSAVKEKNTALYIKQFVCCEKLFTIFQHFNSHKFSEHGIEFLVCGLCDKEEESPLILYKHYIDTHFPGCNILLNYQYFGNKKKPADSLVKSSTNETECTAAQEGILCQCPTCDKKVSNDTSVCKPYVCKVCNFRFRLKHRLNEHMMRTHSSKRYPCDICAQSFTDPYTVSSHKLAKHSSDVSCFKVTCNICFKELASKKSLKAHVRNVHLNRNKFIRLPCPHCPKILSSKAFAKHVQLHVKDSQYICDYCNKTYCLKDRLVYHIHSQHMHQEPVKCDICGHKSKTIQTLRVHKLIKHPKETFSCEICGKTTSTKSSLEIHLITHADERPFVCQTCGKTFKREQNLVQHNYSHSSERPHVCDICGQSFRLATHVKQHMAVHGLGKNHKCLLCNKFFARKRELKLHMSVHETPS